MYFGAFYIVVSALSGTALLLCVNGARLLGARKPRWRAFPFSTRNYYLFLIPFVAPLLIWLLLNPDGELAAFFIGSAILGVVAEAGFTWYWHSLFPEPFWYYHVDTIFRRYSSTLNFIPWAVGGMLYLSVGKLLRFDPALAELSVFWALFAVSLLAVLLTRLAFTRMSGKRSLAFRKGTATAYTYALFPIILAIGGSAFLFPASGFVNAAVFFGLGAWFVEYLFGKGCVFFVSQKLWVYNYMAADNGHITPLSIIPFALGGFWFTTIYHLIAEVF